MRRPNGGYGIAIIDENPFKFSFMALDSPDSVERLIPQTALR
jgi:hypothetical protein